MGENASLIVRLVQQRQNHGRVLLESLQRNLSIVNLRHNFGEILEGHFQRLLHAHLYAFDIKPIANGSGGILGQEIVLPSVTRDGGAWGV